jgi:Flp pilus assembly protein CpaB
LAWAIAVIVAIATVRLVAGDLHALHRRARSLGPDVRVVLAARDLPLGGTVAPSDLRVVVRPASTVNPDALHDVTDGTGRVVAVTVLRDDIVRERDLVARDRSGIDGLVPVGRRAVHVVVRDGFRPPAGVVVDVLAAFDASAARRAEVVARGAVVVAIDAAAGSTEAEPGGSAITLLVTEDEARAVVYAGSFGVLSVALAPPEAACCGASP